MLAITPPGPIGGPPPAAKAARGVVRDRPTAEEKSPPATKSRRTYVVSDARVDYEQVMMVECDTDYESEEYWKLSVVGAVW